MSDEPIDSTPLAGDSLGKPRHVGPSDTGTADIATLDDDNILTRSFVARVTEAVEADEPDEAYRLVQPLHAADIADLFEQVPSEDRKPLARALGGLVSADVLAEVNDYVRDDIMDALQPAQVADLAGQLDTDDAVAIIGDLDRDDRAAVLAELDPEDRAAIESALAYPEESAGRIMQRDLVAVPEHMSVGQLIDYLRDNQNLTTEFWEIFVVDPAHRPIGTCMLSWILRTPREVPLADVMKRDQMLIPVDMDQEEVALRFQKYALISAAVVDGGGRLVGVITADDVVHIIQQEASEDILKLAGAGDGDINEPIWVTIRSRMWWLLVNLGTAVAAAAVPAYFGATIEKIVILSALMGIVTGMGGNAGTQTMAVVVRALATNQLTSSNTMRMIGREMVIAGANGLGLGIIMALGCALYTRDWGLSAVFMAGWVADALAAGLAGILIPLGLERLRIDPAVVSTVFVTWVTDTMGFFAFLGLATAFLV